MKPTQIRFANTLAYHKYNRFENLVVHLRPLDIMVVVNFQHENISSYLPRCGLGWPPPFFAL
jgi:hypothetical protein